MNWQFKGSTSSANSGHQETAMITDQLITGANPKTIFNGEFAVILASVENGQSRAVDSPIISLLSSITKTV